MKDEYDFSKAERGKFYSPDVHTFSLVYQVAPISITRKRVYG